MQIAAGPRPRSLGTQACQCARGTLAKHTAGARTLAAACHQQQLCHRAEAAVVGLPRGGLLGEHLAVHEPRAVDQLKDRPLAVKEVVRADDAPFIQVGHCACVEVARVCL